MRFRSWSGGRTPRPRVHVVSEPGSRWRSRCAWRVKLLNDAVIAEELQRVMAFEAPRRAALKHGALERTEDYEFNDMEIDFEGKAEGVVTHVSVMLSGLGETAEERTKAIKKLIAEVWTEGAPTPQQPKGMLLDAARDALSRRHGTIGKRRWAETVPVGAWVGKEAAERKVEEVLARERLFVEFRPRRAPEVGAALDIRSWKGSGPTASEGPIEAPAALVGPRSGAPPPVRTARRPLAPAPPATRPAAGAFTGVNALRAFASGCPGTPHCPVPRHLCARLPPYGLLH